MKKLILLLLTVLAITAATTLTHSDKYTIQGSIFDYSGEPLIGASILIKGTTEGTVTDFDGKFSILSKDSCATLVFSYTGFNTLESELCAGGENKVVLEEGATLDEVVVTSMGRKKKLKGLLERKKSKKASDAISSSKIKRAPAPASTTLPPAPSGKVITADDIKAMPTRDISAVASTAAGVKSSREDVKIRGTRAEAATYYVDGVKVSGALLKDADVPATISTSGGTPSTVESPVKKEATGKIDAFEKTDMVEIVERDEVIEVKDMKIAEVDYEEEVAPEPVEEPLSAGQLTAGEWNDLENWDDWKTTAGEDLMAMEAIWNSDPGERYSVLVKNKMGKPVPNATVKLLGPAGKTNWIARTNNLGRAELWYNSGKKKASASKPVEIKVQFDGVTETINKITAFEAGVNEVELDVDCPDFEKTEILFVVDATGSMGDEIRYLQAELGDVIKRVQGLEFIDQLYTGSVFYRDIGDEYVVRSQDLSTSTEATLEFIAKQSANGGGDGPEAVETALEEAIMKQKWSADAGARIAFIILDAPPHQTDEIKEKMSQLAKTASEKGIRIVPILASGSQSSCEYLMRSIALTTNSRFLFLTDDSGIGNPHAEPSVGAYDVSFLNDLIFKLIVEFTAYDKCDEQDQQVQVNQAVGEEDTFKASCYPLPANSYVFVDLEKEVDKMEVMDLQGQLLLTRGYMSEGISTVFIDNLPPGTYIFKFIRKQEIQSVKVVKSGV